ncbi:MAG: ABC transporter permease [Phaeodactylibacter sp.]|nr:ABC transporter permease [Phaeodactylibacter sp.]
MFDYDKWQEIFQSISKHKLRAGLTAFGVFWGIFMLVLLMGAGTGLQNAVERDFDIARNAVFVWTQRTSMPYKGLQPGRMIQLKNDDLIAIKSAVPEAAVIAPRLPLRGDFSIDYKDKSASFQVMGDAPDLLKVNPLPIIRGRFINNKDISDKRKVACIGKRVAEVLYGDADPIGTFMEIKGVSFKVVGLFDSNASGQEAIEEVQTVFIPITALQQAFNAPEAIGWFAFIPRRGIPAEQVENKVKALLASRHKIHPDDRRAFGSANIEQEYKEVQMIFGGIRGFSWLVAIGTIFAAMVGVGNIMMIIVKERTREIGIRKSLGATPWSIISMIMRESIVLTGISGYLGLIIGCGLVEAIRSIMASQNIESDFFYNPQINFGTAAVAILVLLLSGTLAGLIPGIRAANVEPVTALRD